MATLNHKHLRLEMSILSVRWPNYLAEILVVGASLLHFRRRISFWKGSDTLRALISANALRNTQPVAALSLLLWAYQVVKSANY